MGLLVEIYKDCKAVVGGFGHFLIACIFFSGLLLLLWPGICLWIIMALIDIVFMLYVLYRICKCVIEVDEPWSKYFQVVFLVFISIGFLLLIIYYGNSIGLELTENMVKK